MINNDDAFLASISHNLLMVEDVIRRRNDQLGLGTDGKFLPAAEAAIRHTFKIMDSNQSGDVDWDEVAVEMKNSATEHQRDAVANVMLHNTIRSLMSVSSGDSVTEDDFVNLLAKKARGQLGASAAVKEAAQRHYAVVGRLLLVDRTKEGQNIASTEGFTSVLESQNISTLLAEDEEEEETAAQLLGKFLGPAAVIPCHGQYLKLSAVCKRIVYKPEFGLFIMALIILVGVIEGYATYEWEDVKHVRAMANSTATGQEEILPTESAYDKSVALIDTVVLFIFVLEMVMKICAEGAQPWKYWLGPSPPEENSEESGDDYKIPKHDGRGEPVMDAMGAEGTDERAVGHT
jgi:hypothetical protein